MLFRKGNSSQTNTVNSFSLSAWDLIWSYARIQCGQERPKNLVRCCTASGRPEQTAGSHTGAKTGGSAVERLRVPWYQTSDTVGPKILHQFDTEAALAGGAPGMLTRWDFLILITHGRQCLSGRSLIGEDFESWRMIFICECIHVAVPSGFCPIKPPSCGDIS